MINEEIIYNELKENRNELTIDPVSLDVCMLRGVGSDEDGYFYVLQSIENKINKVSCGFSLMFLKIEMQKESYLSLKKDFKRSISVRSLKEFLNVKTKEEAFKKVIDEKIMEDKTISEIRKEINDSFNEKEYWGIVLKKTKKYDYELIDDVGNIWEIPKFYNNNNDKIIIIKNKYCKEKICRITNTFLNNNNEKYFITNVDF